MKNTAITVNNVSKKFKNLTAVKNLSFSVNEAECFGYGDHISDLPMLNFVGNPVVVAGDNELTTIAQKQGWEILSS